MTEVVASKPAPAICKGCGAAIFWVTMWSGKKMPIDKKRMVIVYKVKDDVWTTAAGYEPHWGTCPKAGEFKHENIDV